MTLALDHGWGVAAVLHAPEPTLTEPALALVRRAIDAEKSTGDRVERVEMAPELLAELGGKEEGPPEVLLVARQRPDDLSRIDITGVDPGGTGDGGAGGGGADTGRGRLALVVDRPASPGNLGTLIRSADAFGFAGVIVTGHATDPFDPRTVRASTGSLFAVPVVRVASHAEVLAWVDDLAPRPRLIGTDETGDVDADAADLSGPALIVVGNETRGMSRAWRETCDTVVRIPITGAASSLNAAAAGTIIMYEAVRQRRNRT